MVKWAWIWEEGEAGVPSPGQLAQRADGPKPQLGGLAEQEPPQPRG